VAADFSDNCPASKTVAGVNPDRLIPKILGAIVATIVGIQVLFWGALWFITMVAPSTSSITNVTEWCRLRRSDPRIDWPHVFMSAPFEDEVLVRIEGNWASAARHATESHGHHWWAHPLSDGEAVIAGDLYEWKLFRRGTPQPVFEDKGSEEHCRPSIPPDGSRVMCLQVRPGGTAYVLVEVDLRGAMTRTPVALASNPWPRDASQIGSWPWDIHGFTADNLPIVMAQTELRNAGYRCLFARLKGKEVEMVGETSCGLTEAVAPLASGEVARAFPPR
jgi:hypothetical protein